MRCLKKPILLFETIKIVDNLALNLKFHENRVRLACGKFKFDMEKILKNELEKSVLSCDKGTMKSSFESYDDINQNDEKSSQIHRAKLIYDEFGEFKKCEIHRYKARKFESFKLVDINFSYEKKYLDREQINMAYERRAGCDEILMIKDGFVTDSSIANIAIFNGFKWLTPKYALLAGTTRARLLEGRFLTQAEISVKMLMEAKKFAILNAMVEFKEIHKFKFII